MNGSRPDDRAPTVPPLRQRALSRRTFLRGSGALIALPWLDAMVPALGRAAPSPVHTLFVFAPNGVKIDDWRPTKSGADFPLPHLLEPLAPVRDAVTVFTGLAIDGGRAHGDGPGDHARAAASFLTCAHPLKTGGDDIRVGTSIDQVIAERLGAATEFPSLEVGFEAGQSGGVCDSGYSCAYSNNIAWRTPSTPIAKEVDPRALFTRLFGDPAARVSAADEARRRRRLASVLDAATADLKGLRRGLGASDQQKLDEYTDAVRAVETRLEHVEATAADEANDVPADLLARHAGEGYVGTVRTMYELLALAFSTDRTRVATLMLGNGGSNISYRFLGVPEGHHELSHHGKDRAKLEQIRQIDRFRVEEFARFLGRLRELQGPDGDLLDASMVLFGSGISDGNRHNHDDLPILLAGKAGGRLRSGRHVEFPRETPLANVYLSMLAALGIRTDAFADSTGTIAEILR